MKFVFQHAWLRTILLLFFCFLASVSVTASSANTVGPTLRLDVAGHFSLPCGEISGDTVFYKGLIYVNLERCPDGWSSGTHALTSRGYVYDLQQKAGFQTRLEKGYRQHAIGADFGTIDSVTERFIGVDRRVYWLRPRGAAYKSDYRQDCGNGVIRIGGFEKTKSCLLIFSLTEDGQIAPHPMAAFKEADLNDAVKFAVSAGAYILGYDSRFLHPVLLKLVDGRWQTYRNILPAAGLNVQDDSRVVDRCGSAEGEVFYCAYSTFGRKGDYGVMRYDVKTGATRLFHGLDLIVPVVGPGVFVMAGERSTSDNLYWVAYGPDGHKLYDARRDDERGSPPEYGYGGKNRVATGYSLPAFSPDGARLYAIRSPDEFDIFQTQPFGRLITLKPEALGLPYFESFAVDKSTGKIVFCSRRKCVVASLA